MGRVGDWLSIVAAVVGAVAALAGVLLTQRASLRQAREARVWNDTVAAYASATEWAFDRSHELTHAQVAWDEQRLVSDLPAELVTKHPATTALQMFASDAVLRQFQTAESACHTAYTAYVEARRSGPYPATYGSELKAALAALEQLQAQVRLETRR
jgi:hypothetical protein